MYHFIAIVVSYLEHCTSNRILVKSFRISNEYNYSPYNKQKDILRYKTRINFPYDINTGF